MNENDIKLGVEYAFSLEKEIAFMEETVTLLEKRINSLGIKRQINKPPAKEINAKETKFMSKILAICICIGLVYGFMEGKASGHGSGGLDVILTVPISLVIYGGIGLVVGAVLGFLVDLIVGASNASKAEAINRRYEDAAMSEYMKLVEEEERRLQEEREEKISLQKELSDWEKMLDEQRVELTKLYDAMGILPEYRGFIQMGYMYHQVRIGDKLAFKGRGGLYDQVDSDLRADRIANKINERLDRVIDSNNRLYGVLCEINETSREMANTLERESLENKTHRQQVESALSSANKALRVTAISSAITAYNTNRIRKIKNYEEFRRRIGVD